MLEDVEGVEEQAGAGEQDERGGGLEGEQGAAEEAGASGRGAAAEGLLRGDAGGEKRRNEAEDEADEDGGRGG